MEPKLTFILPVYNVEAYLPVCLNSLLSQCTGDCQTVLVDDGSTDGSGAVCDRYQREFPGIRVLHQENRGLSAARNAGLELARGRYVCFVDSDDCLAENSVGRLLDWIDSHDCDLCFLQTVKFYPDGRECPMGDGLEGERIRGKSRREVLEQLASCAKFPASAWGKLLKRSFLEENGLRFPGDRRLSEDLPFCLDAFLAAQTFDCLDFPFYRYRQDREGSITHAVSARYYFDTALFVENVCSRFPSDREPEGALALSCGAYEYAVLLWQARQLPREDRNRAWRWLKTYRGILRYGKSPRTRLIAAVSRGIGLHNTAALLDVYQKHRK